MFFEWDNTLLATDEFKFKRESISKWCLLIETTSFIGMDIEDISSLFELFCTKVKFEQWHLLKALLKPLRPHNEVLIVIDFEPSIASFQVCKNVTNSVHLTSFFILFETAIPIASKIIQLIYGGWWVSHPSYFDSRWPVAFERLEFCLLVSDRLIWTWTMSGNRAIQWLSYI